LAQALEFRKVSPDLGKIHAKNLGIVFLQNLQSGAPVHVSNFAHPQKVHSRSIFVKDTCLENVYVASPKKKTAVQTLTLSLTTELHL